MPEQEQDHDQHIGLQNPDEDEMPSEMQDYGFAAFRHAVGLGPHPGEYKGPPRRKRAEGEPTEANRERAREEEQGEISAKKMHAAHRGEELGPSEFTQQQEQQRGALQRQATTAGQAQAAQAQAGMKPPNAPPAPSGPSGVTKPFPAQQEAGALPTTGKMSNQPEGQEAQE